MRQFKTFCVLIDAQLITINNNEDKYYNFNIVMNGGSVA